jgi:NADH dehydrogenase
MVQWAWSYLTWQRGARLITGELGPSLAPPGRPLGDPTPGDAALAPGPSSPSAPSGTSGTSPAPPVTVPAYAPVVDARRMPSE